MAVSNNNNEKPHSLTHIWNQGFDRTNQLPWIQTLEYTPTNDAATEPSFSRSVSKDLEIFIDETTTENVTYIGYAAPATGTDEANWRIKKIDETSDFELTWADGDTEFNNVWDDRASLSYS